MQLACHADASLIVSQLQNLKSISGQVGDSLFGARLLNL